MGPGGVAADEGEPGVTHAVAAVEAIGLSKAFGSLKAVDDLSLSVARGEVYGVLGPHGAGKTTFLRMLFGLVGPDSGDLRVFGRTWREHDIAVLDGVAGFIESPRFYPYLTARSNLDGLALLNGGTGRSRVEEVLARVDLSDRADERVAAFSHGLRQRLAVAASLLRDPRLLVLDEPVEGLDQGGIGDLRALVGRLAGDGLTVLLSSHHVDEVQDMCDNVTIMSRGAVTLRPAA